MVFLASLILIVNILDVGYVHIYAFMRTIQALILLNKKQEDPHEEAISKRAMIMLLYWVTFVLVSLVQGVLSFLPGIDFVRVLLLTAMLTPKVNLKQKLYSWLFEGERPEFENYLSQVKAYVRGGLQALKKLE